MALLHLYIVLSSLIIMCHTIYGSCKALKENYKTPFNIQLNTLFDKMSYMTCKK